MSKEETKRKIIKNSIIFYSATFIQRILNALLTFLVARLLGPFYYGIWQWFSVFVEYGRFSSLGIGFALSREYPYRRAKGDYPGARNAVEISFTFTIISSLFFAFILVLGGLLYPYSTSSGLYRSGFVLIAVVIFLQQLFTYYNLLLRAKKEFTIAGKYQVLFGFVKFVVVLILVKFFSFYGLLFGLIFSNLVVVALYAKKEGVPLAKKLDTKLLKQMLIIGISIVLLGLGFSIFTSIDRIMIMRMLNPKQLGYYGLGVSIFLLVYAIRSPLGAVLAPYIYAGYGKTNDIRGIKHFLEKATYLMMIFMGYITGLLFILLPLLIVKFLPAYVPSIKAIQILLLGTYFIGINYIDHIIIAVGKQFQVIKMYVVFLGLNVVLNYLFIKAGYGIYGVAAGTAISYMVYHLVTYAYTMSFYRNKIQILGVLAGNFIPLLGAGLVIYVFYLLKLNMILQAVLYTLLYTPVFIWLAKREGLTINSILQRVKR